MWQFAQFAPFGYKMDDNFPHIKKIKKANIIDIIKEQNIYIKEYIIKNTINAGYNMCVYDIKNKCYYCYNLDKDIDNNIMKMVFIIKFIRKNKKNELRFYSFFYKGKIEFDKYKSIYNNKLIYIFGLLL